MKRLKIKPLTEQIGPWAVKRGWFDDENVNFQMGFGRGEEGKLRARQSLLGAIEDKTGRFWALIYKNRPIGFYSQVPLSRKRVKIDVFVPHTKHPEGFMADVYRSIAEKAFEETGAHRLETCIFRKGSRGPRRELKAAGFTNEAVLKAAHWEGGNAWDFLLFRCLKWEFGHVAR